MNSPRVSLAALMGAQAQVTFNDNAAKLMLIALAQFPGVLAGTDVDLVRTILAGLLIAPFVLFSPVAGWLNDRFAKSRVLNITLGMQFGAMLLLLLALWAKSLWGAVGCFVLLALQATVFAPAKRGILRELVGPQELSRNVGVMEMLSVGMILAGGFAGGQMFDRWTKPSGDPWQGALVTALVLTVLSALSWAVFQLVQRTKAQSDEPFRVNLLWRHGAQLAELWRDRPLLRATYGIMFFYGVGAYLYLLFIQMGADLHAGGIGSGSDTSYLLLCAGAGTVLGNFAAGAFSRRGIELGLAPLGGILLMVSFIALGRIGHIDTAFYVWLAVGGFATGLFLVPLYAFVQEHAGGHRRGRVLAAVGLLDSSTGLAANGLFLFFAGERWLNWEPVTQLYVLAGITFLMVLFGLKHLPHQTACAVMRLIGPLFYRVKAVDTFQVPAKGGALVICNHLSYVDAVVLQIASPRILRFIVFGGAVKNPVARFLFRAAGVIPVAPNKAMKGIRLAWDALKAGELVCVFPEGAISRTGQLMELKHGFGLISERAKVPVVPAFIDGLWGSIFSFAGNRYLWKSPRLMPTPVCVIFGPPIPPEKVDRATARIALLDLGATAFHQRPVLRRHLAREIVRALAKRPWHQELVDRTAERRVVTSAQLLAVAAALSRRIRRTIPEHRVGVVMPPGAGAHIVNLAIACAGKVPVNLNFTAGRAAIEASLRIGEIRSIITADAMRAKIPNFPFPANTLDLKREIEALGGKKAILPWLLAAWLLPNQWVADLLELPRVGDNEEAGLLFTSGSSGEPKGVVLSHRNILANCSQISSLSILPDSAVMLGCLPVFHSFGYTVTLWYPMLRGCKVVTVPSPLDTRRIIESIHQEKATVMIGAPTFIRPFLKKATKEELASLHLVVTGAEKLPMDLYEGFLEKFGIEVLQGYGLTETTPASNINQHHPAITTGTAEHQLGKKTGAVGRLMPGMSARILDPDTGEELPMHATGMVWLRGANVFGGYLKDPAKTAAALRGDWFMTGDLGWFDDDGFLYIEGRLSRFSKIGGEMVPHGTIEAKIIEVFSWDQNEAPTLAIAGIADPVKGEAIVLLTTKEVTTDELRSKLLDAGLPNLWIPRIVRRVEKIPVLGTGKLDLAGCRELALQLTKETAGT